MARSSLEGLSIERGRTACVTQEFAVWTQRKAANSMPLRMAVVHNLPSGGAKRLAMEQLRGLNERGHQLIEFRPSNADSSFAPFYPFVVREHIFRSTSVRLSPRRIPFLTPYVHAVQVIRALVQIERRDRKIAERVDHEGCDIALVHDCQVALYPYVLRYQKTPTVFYCHDAIGPRTHLSAGPGGQQDSLPERVKRAYYRPAKGLVEQKRARDQAKNIRSANLVLVNSRFSQLSLLTRFGIRSEVASPGVNVDSFRRSDDQLGDYVLTVGGLIYGKGHRLVVEAIGTIPEARRPRLRIAANAQDPAEVHVIRDLARDLGVDVQIETIMDDVQLAQVYSRAQAFVYAPLQESLGLALLEAAACGTPAVAVAEGGVRETVRDDETGWLVPRDAAVLGDRLDQLLSNPMTRSRMSKAGVAWVRSDWTWSAAIDRLESILHRVGAA